LNPSNITKKDLVDLAWGIYSCPTSYINTLQLILVNYSTIYHKYIMQFNENDIVEPSVFFKNLDYAIEGSPCYSINLKISAEKIKEILDLDLDQMPLYINDLLLNVIATWRLKKRI